ncbi:MAG TPA: VanZ family protein [Burkholderiales bacterium]|nr:VanZ family protein [Burkholderiales bacterium]
MLLVYVLLVAYASLYPFTGWRDVGLSPFAYLIGPLPRYATAFDITVNLAGYVPFGFLAIAALYPRARGVPAFLIAVVAAAVLSLVLEAAQSYLPARFPNNLDVLCNVGGAALGAALGQHFTRLIAGGPLSQRRAAAFIPGTGTDVGLVLIGLWFFIQLNPAALLFGTGDLRDLLAPLEGRARRPEFFVSIEAFTTAANLVAVALLLSALAAPGRPVRGMVLGALLAALAVKSAAFAVLMRAESGFTWLTPGAQIGLAVGIALALAALGLPRTARLIIAAVLLMAATVLVNLSPPNPYLADSLKVWQQGHFLNFNGLTRVVSALWPFIALGYLTYLASRRRDALG